MEADYGIGVNNRYALFFGNAEEGDALEKKASQEKSKSPPKVSKKKAKPPQQVVTEPNNNTINSANKDLNKSNKVDITEKQKVALKAEKKSIDESKPKEDSKKGKLNKNPVVPKSKDSPATDSSPRNQSQVNRNENNGRGRGRGGKTSGGVGRNDMRRPNDNGNRNGKSSDPPSADQRSDKRMSDKPLNMNCYECNEIGHLARDCPKRQAARAQQRLDDRKCYGCNETGHISKDCPNKQQISPKPDRTIKTCHECGDEGHLVRNCEKRAQQKRSNGRGIENEKCYRCEGLGHFARECNSDIPKATRRNTTKAENSDRTLKESNEESLVDNDVIRTDEKGEDDTPATVDEKEEGIMEENREPLDLGNGKTNEEINNAEEEKEAITYTLDEWKSKQGEKKGQTFNIRKANEGANLDTKMKTATAYKKEKEETEKEEEEEMEIYPQRANRQKKITDLGFNFNDKKHDNPEGRGSRKDGRGERKSWNTNNITNKGARAPDIFDDSAFPSLG